jgi:hypothetical protein
MNDKKHFLKTGKAGFVLGVLLLAALAEYAGNADGQLVKVILAPPVVVVAPPVVTAPVVVEDDYVYYPNYEIYYNSSRHQYAHLDGGAWVWSTAPDGVAVDVLLASPSARMDFHDSLEKHHAEMLQKYPRNWRPSDGHQDVRQEEHQDQKEDRNVNRPDHDKNPPEQ